MFPKLPPIVLTPSTTLDIPFIANPAAPPIKVGIANATFVIKFTADDALSTSTLPVLVFPEVSLKASIGCPPKDFVTIVSTVVLTPPPTFLHLLLHLHYVLQIRLHLLLM